MCVAKAAGRCTLSGGGRCAKKLKKSLIHCII
nr:MAG TPA: hypothetical protein [Bacteriophage sp.]